MLQNSSTTDAINTESKDNTVTTSGQSNNNNNNISGNGPPPPGVKPSDLPADFFDADDEDVSSEYYTESEDDGDSSFNSNDSLDSIDDEALKALKQKSGDSVVESEEVEDPALIVITVERGGTTKINGKYRYKGMQRNHPLWEREDDSNAKLWYKYDNLWTIEYDNEDLYISYTNRKLPPSSAWEAVDNGIYPAPGVVLHRIKQETVEHDPDQDEDAYTPIETIEEKFNVNAPLGIAFTISNNMVCVRELSIGQAIDKNIQEKDILSSVDGEDVALIGSVEKLGEFFQNHIAKKKAAGEDTMILKFGRRKNMFPIVILNRAGTKQLDGKYSIHGRENEAFKFVMNDDPTFEINRIFYDEEGDEAVWVIRENLLLARQLKPHLFEDENKESEEKTDENNNNKESSEDNKEENKETEAEAEKNEIIDEKWLLKLFKSVDLSKLDKDGNNAVDKEEFRDHFHKLGVNQIVMDRVFDTIDKNGDGDITTFEFFQWRAAFTVEKMRDLLPEFCPKPAYVIKQEEADARRKAKKAAEEEEKRKKEEEAKRVKEEEAKITSVEKLKSLGYKQLKDLCVEHKLPVNGRKAMLFEKLRKHLFPTPPPTPKASESTDSNANSAHKKNGAAQVQASVLVTTMPSLTDTPNESKSSDPPNNTTNDKNNNKSSKSNPTNADDDSDSSEFESTDEDDDDDDDEDDIEAAQNTNVKDFYCGMCDAKAQVPPNYGWEAINPNGVWPAPGLTVYEIPLDKQDLAIPNITKCTPAPSSATIYWTCEGNLVPKVCPHMDHWYEVIAYNLSNKSIDNITIRCNESPAVFTNLINGNDYQFVVQAHCEVNVENSLRSDIVTPLLLPNKPKITNITGGPNELNIWWKCKDFNDPMVKATVTLFTDPIVPIPQGFTANENGEIILKDPTKPIELKQLETGTDYTIQLRATNTVAVMETEPEIATPAHAPPQPNITKIEGGNRELIIDVNCDGWNQKLQKCWFEVELTPPEPTLADLQDMLYGGDPKAIKAQKKKEKELKNSKKPGSPEPASDVLDKSKNNSHRPRMSMLHSAKQATLNRLFTAAQTGGNSGHWNTMLAKQNKVNSNDDGNNNNNNNDNKDEEEEEIPEYKRAKRYTTLPIVISPVVNGEYYTVVVRARNYTGKKETQESDLVQPKGVPPQPRIVELAARDGYVKITFECDDYATEEYRANYEFLSMPSTTKVKTRRFQMKFRNLDNGTKYYFKCRGYNKCGKGPWSEISTEKGWCIPLKFPSNINELRMVPGNEEISMYWVAENMLLKKYDGWFEINTKPHTYTLFTKRQQCSFKKLINNEAYTFKLYSVNKVGRSRALHSTSAKSKANIKQKLYKTLQERTSLAVGELRDEYLKRVETKDKSEKKVKQSKKGAIASAQQKFNVKKDKDKDKNKKDKKDKKDKKSKKDKKKKKKDDISSMMAMMQNEVSKQKSERKLKQNSVQKKENMAQQREQIYSRVRRESVMDTNRVDKFGQIFGQKKQTRKKW